MRAIREGPSFATREVAHEEFEGVVRREGAELVRTNVPESGRIEESPAKGPSGVPQDRHQERVRGRVEARRLRLNLPGDERAPEGSEEEREGHDGHEEQREIVERAHAGLTAHARPMSVAMP